jgi:hypothetical protein
MGVDYSGNFGWNQVQIPELEEDTVLWGRLGT